MTGTGNGRCRQLMQQFRQIDFCLIETTLYLDAYPDDRDALAYYHRLLEERRRIAEQIEAVCGPLTIYGNSDIASWNWVKTPWPWEAEAD